MVTSTIQSGRNGSKFQKKLEATITIIKRYEEIVKIQKKKIIIMVVTQGQINKDSEQFCKTVGLSKSTINFKISHQMFDSKTVKSIISLF